MLGTKEKTALVGAGVLAGLLGAFTFSKLKRPKIEKNKTLVTPAKATYQLKRIGFIGMGTINCAVVTGFLKSPKKPVATSQIVVGKRGRCLAELKHDFPSISILEDNQKVVEASDWIFVGTPSGIASAKTVFGNLTFRPDQVIISFVAGVPVEELQALARPARVVQSFPLPPARDNATAVICAPNIPEVTELLALLGTAIPVDDPHALTRLVPMTCVMGHFYSTQQACFKWLQKEGIDAATSSSLVSSMFETFNHASKKSQEGFQHLVAEQTPGGINEFVLTKLGRTGAYTNMIKVLDEVFVKFGGSPSELAN